MCRSAKGDSNVFNKVYMQKVLGQYWKGCGAGKEVIK